MQSQQGTGVNRAALTPGHLTPEQCARAVTVVCANAVDAVDAAFLIDVLGIEGFTGDPRGE